MFEKPKQLTTASGLAFIGAIISFVAAFIEFTAGNSTVNEVIIIGALLLAGLMFLAISGALSSKGQWSWKMTMFFIFLTAVLIAVAFLYHEEHRIIDDIFALAQFVIVLIIAVLVSGRNASRWVNLNKA